MSHWYSKGIPLDSVVIRSLTMGLKRGLYSEGLLNFKEECSFEEDSMESLDLMLFNLFLFLSSYEIRKSIQMNFIMFYQFINNL